MATIANLVAKLGLDDSGWSQKVAQVTKQAAKLAAMATDPIRKSGEAAAQAARQLDSVDNHAKKYLKTLLGIGSASAMIAVGAKHALAIDRASSDAAKATGGVAGPGNLAESYDRVTAAVAAAYDAFGSAFSKAAGLAGVLDQLANVVNHLAPAFEWVGHALGTVASWFSSATPLSFAFIIALKAAAIAAGVLFFILQKLAIRALFIWLVGASPLTIAWAAAVWLVNAGLAVMNGLLTYAAALGAPIWLAVAAAVALVAAVVYGLVKAWQWLTGATQDAGQSAVETSKAMTKAAGEAKKMEEALGKRLDDAANTPEMKAAAELDAYIDLLGKAGVAQDQWNAKVAAFVRMQKKITGAEAGKKVAGMIADLQKTYDQIGMGHGDKAADDVRRAGGDVAAQSKASDLAQQIEGQNVADEKRKKIASEIADIEKATAQAGLTESQRKLDDFRRLTNDAKQIAAFQKQAAALDDATKKADAAKTAAQQEKDLANSLAKIREEAAQAGMTESEKRLASLQKMGAAEEQIAAARKNMQLKDAVVEAKKLAEAGKKLAAGLDTPMEKYKKQVEDILRLREVGAIDSNTANRALAGAQNDLETASNKGGGGGKNPVNYQSPTAVLRGSAEASLAENRQQNPMTLAANKQIEEAKKLRAVATERLTAIEKNTAKQAQLVVADF